jgi:GTP pyrophosphokinase
MPVPGDSIIGFVTRGRGISIHRYDCPNARALSTDGDRLVDVEWAEGATGTFPVSIRLEALDRPKLLRDVTTIVSDFGININSATSAVGQGIAVLQFVFEVTKILAAVRRVEAVYDAYRITPR